MESTAYFSVPCQVPVQVELLPVGSEPPQGEAFEAEIPDSFRLASEVATLDPASLRAMRSLGETSHELVAYLNLLSRKINALMGYILVQQEQGQPAQLTTAIGASGVIVDGVAEAHLGQHARLKIFLRDEAVSLYCYGQVSAVNESAVEFRFSRLREQDQEILIRATLHLQAKLLKERAARKDS